MVACVAIVLLVAIAKGVQADVSREVEGLGVNVIVVLPGRVEPGTLMFNPNLVGLSFLGEEDAIAVRSVPGVLRSAPLTFAGGGIRRGTKEAFPITIATTPEWFSIRPVRLREGAVFGAAQGKANVCVIGSIAKETLFGAESAVGKTIEYDRRPYTIVGVTQEVKTGQSLFAMGGFENVVYFPYHALKREIPDLPTDRVMIQSSPTAEPKALVARLEATLAKRLDRQQYSVLTQEDLLGLVFKIMGILTWLLTGLTSIALFVGGFGIMAVMLMSVNERSKEIGVRKAAGAKRGAIFSQFLIEAVAQSALGGLAGLGLSAIVIVILERNTPIKPELTGGIVALALGVCIGIGALFGVLPAMNAARKDPVAALRAE